MDVPKEILIDTAINTVGYLIAGLSTVLLYKAMSRRSPKPARMIEAPVATPIPQVVQQPRETGQFIPLAHNAPRATETTGAQHTLDNGQRDRQAIMRIAREMLKAGATIDRVRQVLPITTAEAALLARVGQ